MKQKQARRKRRQLNLKQRCAMLSGQSKWMSQGIEEAQILPFTMSDGPHGVRQEQPDGTSFPATCFPPEVTLASSWNPSLVYRVAAAIAEEAGEKGIDVILGPGLNIKRSPLCGRNFEYFSEDPLLSGLLGKAYVQGAKSRRIETCVKHFFANNQEYHRMTVDAQISKKAIQEIYIRPFEIVIREADPGMVMAAYNRVNGVYATENQTYLLTLLRDQWHYQGVTVSDWSAVHNRVDSVRAGLDLEMPDSDGINDEKVYQAVQQFRLPVACVNRSVERLIAFSSRCEENRKKRSKRSASHLRSHWDLAREAGAEGIVLLENKHDLLPLRPDQLSSESRILVVGQLAKNPRIQGGGSSQVNADRVCSPWSAIKKTYASVQLDYADGYTIEEDVSSEVREHRREEAVRKSKAADIVLLFLGLPDSKESESWDRENMDLPKDQIQLLDEVNAVQKHTVVMVQNGGAVLLNHAARSGALLEMWLGGEACGSSLCDVLTGEAVPSGKLAETIPKRLEDTPAYLNFPGDGQKVIYGEDIYVGYRFYDQKRLAVRYPFGYGLSYADFEYCGFNVTEDQRHRTLSFDVAVHNYSDFPAKETVQIYMGLPDSAVSRPPKVLVAFQKAEIQAGSTYHYHLTIPIARLAFFDVKKNQWRVESGQYHFYCGASSRDIKFEKTWDISFKETEPLVTMDSTVDEILKTQRGSKLFQLALDWYHRLTGVQIDMQDDFMKHSVLSTPLSKVPMLSGGMITDRMLKRIIRYINHDVKHLKMGWLVLRECHLPKIMANLLKAQIDYQENQELPYSIDTPIDLLLASPPGHGVLASALGPSGEKILSSKYVKMLTKTHLTLRQIQKITPLHLFKESELEKLNKRIKTINNEITDD